MNNPSVAKIKESLGRNMVTILFSIICIIAYIFADTSFTHIAGELFTRIGRNSFIVLALIIPVLTGMGLNFSIVIGAMAAQFGIFVAIDNGFTGIKGFLIATIVATPIALFFGFFVGKLFNRMKGSEMIGGLVLGYFADGIYQFLFLFILGGIVAIKNPKHGISGTRGVINAIDLKDNIKYSLDKIPLISILDFLFFFILATTVIAIIYNVVIKKRPISSCKQNLISAVIVVIIYALSFIPAFTAFLQEDRLLLLSAIEIFVAINVLYQIYRIITEKFTNLYPIKQKIGYRIKTIVVCAVLYGITYIPEIEKAVLTVKIPVMTYMCIAALYVFNGWIIKTKLGQNMRTVGQSQTVANAAGINVNKTRIIALVFSTVLACWGQLINLQNLGTFSTYQAHTNIGLYAVASLLVGGASVQKATSKQAITGVILFHTLAILAPIAGTNMFNDAQIGEYFRTFIIFAVIAVSLIMHAYNTNKKKSTALSTSFSDEKSA